MNWKVAGWMVALLLMSRVAFAAPPLSEVAQKVADASQWTGNPVYLWTSESEVLSWQAVPTQDPRRIRRFLFKGVSINLSTGK